MVFPSRRLLLLALIALSPALADAQAQPVRRIHPQSAQAGLRGWLSAPQITASAPDAQTARHPPATSVVVIPVRAGAPSAGRSAGATLEGRLDRPLTAENSSGLGQGLGAYQSASEAASGDAGAPSVRNGPVCRAACAERRVTCLATDDSACNVQWSQCIFNCSDAD